MTEFTTTDGCTVTLMETPEGDTMMQMKVEPNAKAGLTTATVFSAPEGREEILGRYASVRLTSKDRAALRAALGEDAAPRSHEVMGIDASMPLTDWVRRALGIELTDAQRAEYEARDRQAPGVALDGYEAVNSAEEERMAQELMEEHGYRPKEGALVPTSDVRQMLVEAHRKATDEYDHILTRQSDLLTSAVTALRGDPPELVWWSHHDVAELAQAAVGIIARFLGQGVQFDALTEEAKAHFMEQARKAIVEEAGK